MYAMASTDVYKQSVEFEIGREYVGRIVGSHGASVNRLRDQLGVKLDFNDEVDEKESQGKKKKVTVQKSKVKVSNQHTYSYVIGCKCHVKITGRKENVEEAKRRILGQVEKLADETSEILRIPRQYHSGLIGQSGKYVIRVRLLA